MIKLQLDWSALKGLLESNDGLVVEIKNAVKANFVKGFVKQLLTDVEVESMKKEIRHLFKTEAIATIAEIKKDRLGRADIIGSLHPEVREMIANETRESLMPTVRDIMDNSKVSEEQQRRIERYIADRVDRGMAAEIQKKVDAKIAAIVAAANS